MVLQPVRKHPLSAFESFAILLIFRALHVHQIMKKLFLLVPFLLQGIFMPSLALEETQVSRKMADLQVLMLVNQKQEPRILPDLGAVAAFSNTAASALQRSFPNSEQLFFKRVAIDEFNMIYEGLRSNNPDLQKSYLPDPSQFDPVVGSLLNQGVPFQGAKQKALSEPFLFCPDPLIRINTNSSASKKAVLCSQNYVAISLLVNKFNGSNQEKSLVKIYTIEEIRSFLLTNDSLDAYDLVILPLPGMER